MLKQGRRIIAALILAAGLAAGQAAGQAAGLPAQADGRDDLAAQWGAQAAGLEAELAALKAALEAAPGRGFALPQAVRADLVRFAATADQLAVAVERTGGPKDLRCIYRGLSEEIGVQLDALEAAGGGAKASHAALNRLMKAADDAQAIAQATQTGSDVPPAAGAAASALAGCRPTGMASPAALAD